MLEPAAFPHPSPRSEQRMQFTQMEQRLEDVVRTTHPLTLCGVASGDGHSLRSLNDRYKRVTHDLTLVSDVEVHGSTETWASVLREHNTWLRRTYYTYIQRFFGYSELPSARLTRFHRWLGFKPLDEYPTTHPFYRNDPTTAAIPYPYTAIVLSVSFKLAGVLSFFTLRVPVPHSSHP